MFEHVLGRALHPVQYGLVGLALTVFYLLLLSLTEVVGFGPAYLLAAAAVVVQVTAYCGAILRSWRPAAVLGAVMAGLYAGLYSLLQVEERALLGGTLVLFAVLSLLMMVTRNLAGGPVDQAAEGERAG